MNNFKTSVITSVDKLNAKMVQVEKVFESYPRGLPRTLAKDNSELSQLRTRFEGELKDAKEVLIQSIFTAIFEDLR
jgi:RecA-family ATPase